MISKYCAVPRPINTNILYTNKRLIFIFRSSLCLPLLLYHFVAVDVEIALHIKHHWLLLLLFIIHNNLITIIIMCISSMSLQRAKCFTFYTFGLNNSRCYKRSYAWRFQESIIVHKHYDASYLVDTCIQFIVIGFLVNIFVLLTFLLRICHWKLAQTTK